MKFDRHFGKIFWVVCLEMFSVAAYLGGVENLDLVQKLFGCLCYNFDDLELLSFAGDPKL